MRKGSPKFRMVKSTYVLVSVLESALEAQVCPTLSIKTSLHQAHW